MFNSIDSSFTVPTDLVKADLTFHFNDGATTLGEYALDTGLWLGGIYLVLTVLRVLGIFAIGKAIDRDNDYD